MTAFTNRIARLEALRAPDPDDTFELNSRTDEELLIGLLDIYRHELEDLGPTEPERAEIAVKVSEIEERIRAAAKLWADPRYEPHRQRVLGQWDGARGASGIEFVPEIIACGHWWRVDRPRLVGRQMAWRAATRGRADIAALIAEGEAQAALQAKTAPERGIRAAVVWAGPRDPEPAIAVPSVPEPFAPAPIATAYPAATEAPARGSFAVDYDPYEKFRPR